MNATIIDLRNRLAHRPVHHLGPPATGFRRGVEAIRASVLAWRKRARARREFSAADPRMLADLGLSPAQAAFLAGERRLD